MIYGKQNKTSNTGQLNKHNVCKIVNNYAGYSFGLLRLLQSGKDYCAEKQFRCPLFGLFSMEVSFKNSFFPN